MENNNKPQWLIDAENEINSAAKTKWGKLTDSQFRQYTNLTMSREEYMKRASNGGKIRASQESHAAQFAAIKTTEHQKKANAKAQERNRELDNFKRFPEGGTKAATIANSNHRHDRMMEVIDALPTDIEFGFEEFTVIAERFDRKWWYIKEIHRFYPEIIEKTGRGKYKKIQ